MRIPSVGLAVVLAGCVTESLAICVNCGTGFTIVDLRGRFAVALTATSGVAAPCGDLTVAMSPAPQWEGCLTPRGGSTDSTLGVIRLEFVDSAGTPGELEFFDLTGRPDSVAASWRSSCLKQISAAGPCPRGSGSAAWTRLEAAADSSVTP